MVSEVLLVGVVVAVFVGFNIGGSSTGIAWGPAVGAGVVNKTGAAAIMTVFVFIGGWTVGRNVIDTLGEGIVPSSVFSLEASIAVLFFIGLGILIANVFGVPVPTSMTAVGSIAGVGLATGTLNWETMGRIVSWWVVTPVIAFWIGGVVGRYLYPYMDRYIRVDRSPGALLVFDRSGPLPWPGLGPNTTRRELITTVGILLICCYMSFSAGASNVANAVAPLIGSGALDVGVGIALATVAIGLGAFTIARRTMDSVGNDLTDLPLLAALVVAIVASTITTFLSWLGIPISLVMATVMTIVGLGWGRASRTATVRDIASGNADVDLSINALTAEPRTTVPRVGEERPEDLDEGTDLVNPAAIARFVSLWIIGPSAAAGLSYGFFVLVPIV